ncbi:MAG TPA: secondary thiamine-phosphate synthase enzyme YjbQ [Kofleriaceae bacterium]|nr:secondary thiamine-phosphate synthase enzyme YjbQ [Kofleriaceae bacterium]
MPATETIDVRTTTRSEMVDITALVRAAVKKSGVASGLACVFCPHTTAAVTIQENTDPTVKADMVRHLSLVVPREAGSERPDQNSDAHIKGSLVGQSLTLIVDGGRPQLGHWQAVFFCEFDGPRERRVLVRVIPG